MADGSTPRFSVRVGGGDIKRVVDMARIAEAAGFDQVWTGNDLFGPSGVVALAAMATATSRIGLGSGVFDVVTLHPAQIASIAAALQSLSHGRFHLGVGAGSDVFFSRAGVTPDRPVPRTREGLLSIRALLSGTSPATVEAVTSAWDPAAVLSDPPVDPVPIYVGAMGPKMLGLAGEYADGALSLCLPPEQIHDVALDVRRGSERSQRAHGEFDLAACLWCSIADDAATARDSMAAFIARYSGSLSVDALVRFGYDPDEFARVQALMNSGAVDDAIAAVTPAMLKLGVVGSPEEIAEQAEALLDSGVRHVSFGPPLGPDPRAALRSLGGRVLSTLRDRG